MMRGGVILMAALAGTGCTQSTEAPTTKTSTLPEVQLDDFTQAAPGPVDVLLVIDDSPTLDPHRATLADGLAGLLQTAIDNGVDFHMGVVSTDLDDASDSGKLRISKGGHKWVQADTPKAEAVLRELVDVGTGGSQTEKGIGAVFAALEILHETNNVGFSRDEARIHTVVFSNEPDVTPPTLVTAPEFADWYVGLKDDDDSSRFSSFVDGRNGVAYLAMTDEIGGVYRDISAPDWVGGLDDVEFELTSPPKEFFLTRIPVPSTLDVQMVEQAYDGSDIVTTFDRAVENKDGTVTGDWTYNMFSNSVTFIELVPPVGSQVQVTYDVDDGAPTSR